MNKGDFFAGQDRYLYYDSEDVLFFWDHQRSTVRMKFVGQDHDVEVSQSQRLFNDAILGGREIARDEYDAGRPA